MMSTVLAWILKNPAWAALLVVAGLLATQTVRLSLTQARAGQAKAETALVQQRLDTARDAFAAQGASLERQNAAVRGLVALSKSLQSDLDKAAGAQRLMAAAHKKEVARLKAAAVPQDCAGAVAWGAKEGQAIGAAFNAEGAGND